MATDAVTEDISPAERATQAYLATLQILHASHVFFGRLDDWQMTAYIDRLQEIVFRDALKMIGEVAEIPEPMPEGEHK